MLDDKCFVNNNNFDVSSVFAYNGFPSLKIKIGNPTVKPAGIIHYIKIENLKNF